MVPFTKGEVSKKVCQSIPCYKVCDTTYMTLIIILKLSSYTFTFFKFLIVFSFSIGWSNRSFLIVYVYLFNYQIHFIYYLPCTVLFLPPFLSFSHFLFTGSKFFTITEYYLWMIYNYLLSYLLPFTFSVLLSIIFLYIIHSFFNPLRIR